MPLALSIILRTCNSIIVSLAESLKREFQNCIKIYRNKKVVKAITYLVNKYFSI